LLGEPINPGGTAAFGAVILRDGIRVWEASKIFRPQLGCEKMVSNNLAEYSGFEAILLYLLKEGLNKEAIIVRGDSRLVICQNFVTCGYRSKWKMHGGFYLPIALQCKELLKQFPNIAGEWIPREQNFLADELSKRELINARIEFRIQKR
jgi:ribonuclease HI